MEPFTIVVPTRDDPDTFEQVLTALHHQGDLIHLGIRVVFLVNDTQAAGRDHLAPVQWSEHFAHLRPALLRARIDWPTVEENIRHTLGENLDAVDQHFLIVGSSDHVDLQALHLAFTYLRKHQLDLLLVGVLNREVFDGKPVRQFYATPRHLNPKNRLSAETSHGRDTFAACMTDYGPVDYLAFIGCQIYTKDFFRALCEVQSTLSEPLYSIPVATLQLTALEEYSVGFWPDVVVTRIDHLRFGADSGTQSPNWWVVKQRTDRGLSNHLLLSVLSGSLQLSHTAFGTLVQSQTVSVARGRPQYIYSNFLFLLLSQIIEYVRYGATNPALRYNPQELQEMVAFGVRLDQVDIGLPVDQRSLLSRWLQQFHAIGDYSNQGRIDELLAPAPVILALLDTRPGMERWIAQLG